jgi:uroporphyrinogen-III decarboxylase
MDNVKAGEAPGGIFFCNLQMINPCRRRPGPAPGEHRLGVFLLSLEDRLNAIVRGELLKAIDRWGEAGADAIMFCEDWGTQDRLMISPAMWREVFKPEFQALAGRAHEHGMFVLMHSCGKMTAVIEDLIEVGINCLQFDQPTLHGIDYLAKTFGGRMAFWCPVDIQKTLQTRDEKLIRAEAKMLVERLGGFGGGFVAGYYGSNEGIGLTPDVQDIACKAFVEYGDYGH